MILYLIITVIISVVIIHLTYKHYNCWNYQNVDGPKPLPFFGNMLQYFLAEKHYGEIYAEIYK